MCDLSLKTMTAHATLCLLVITDVIIDINLFSKYIINNKYYNFNLFITV